MAKKKSSATGAVAAQKPLSILDKVKGKAAHKAPAKKDDDRPIIILEGKDIPDVADLVQLTTIVGELNPTLTERKKEVNKALFTRFTQTWWDKKQLPKNPRIVIKKHDAQGNAMVSDDMSLMFVVKYRAEGLTGVVPDAEQLPEGKTVEDILLEALTSAQVGLSEQNALRLLSEDGEIKVIQQLELAGALDVLFHSDKPIQAAAAAKLLAYLSADADDDDDAELDVLNAEEKASLLHTVQVVNLKQGFLERAHTYCDNVEQLRKLCEFVKITLQLSSFEFATSDTPKERVERLHRAVAKFMPIPAKQKDAE